MRRTLVSLVAAFLVPLHVDAQENFKRTGSRRPYTHVIPLLAADGTQIDPRAEDARPYSPRATCKACHDVEAIEHGHHFNASKHPELSGRPGEPWILVDARTGTQLPLSYRSWPHTAKPETAGLDAREFLRAFGRQLAGGSEGYAGLSPDAPRTASSGELEIDCLVCHDASRTYSHERWIKAVNDENFAWAPGYAAGLLDAKGSVARLPDGADPKTADVPKVTYDLRRFDAEDKVFLDLVREPPNDTCYACHTVTTSEPERRWTHDGDVHLRAGMSCVDCHRNGIEHHTVRGYEGERHPTGTDVSALSCRGCHLGAPEEGGGRFGAPRPEHAGLPPIHLDLLSCTACHSGPVPAMRPREVQTSMAHALGLATQERTPEDLPRIVEPVFVKEEDGIVRPHRMTWPSFWGFLEEDGSVLPLAPEEAYPLLRRALRVRRDFLAEAIGRPSLAPEELAVILAPERVGVAPEERTEEERAALERGLRAKERENLRAKIAEGLAALVGKRSDAVPVFVMEGRLHRLDPTGEGLVSLPHEAARPVSWPLAHDVRPTRLSLGATSCFECHAEDAAFAHAEVEAPGPLAEESVPMHVYLDQSPDLMSSWELSFQGRSLFKVVSVVALALTGLLLLLHLFLGLSAFARFFAPRRKP